MTIKEQLVAKNRNTQKIDKKINALKLFKAVISRNCDEIRCLINNGVDINEKDEDGWTALMYATDNGDKRLVKLLIELGADVNIIDDDGQTALMHAIFINADEIAKILIKNNADVNVKDNQGQTPLMIAALSNAKEMGELLILEGADIDATDNLGKTAVDIARETWSFKLSDFFLKKHSVFAGTIQEHRTIENYDTNISNNIVNLNTFLHFIFSGKKTGDIVTFDSIRAIFLKKYPTCKLLKTDVDEWLQKRKTIVDNHQFFKSKAGFEYITLPTNCNAEEIYNLLNAQIPKKIRIEELNCTPKTITEINKLFTSKGLIIKQYSNSRDEYILTIDCNKPESHDMIKNEFSKIARTLFLRENVYYSIETKELCNFFKEKYDITISKDLLLEGIEMANSQLVDINISLPNNIDEVLKSEFKNNNTFTYVECMEKSICPVCGSKFTTELLAGEKLKEHILEYHTSKATDCSILTQNSDTKFYCHQCNKNGLFLRDAILKAVLGHLCGECRKESFWKTASDKQIRNSTQKQTRIYSGSAFGNNLAVLGNSGQLLRDNGRFGSYPNEDNYGDGDISW